MVMYEIFVLFHILAVVVAAGAVSVTDYLHLVGLKKKKLEKQLKNIYPNLSRLVNYSLIIIIITGMFLVYRRPEFLEEPLFIIKMALVFIVSINGLYLQKTVSPHLDLCVLKGTSHCSKEVLYTSSISGSISIVSWYSIIVLALTKELGYTYLQFISVYLAVIFVAVIFAIYIEKKARRWH